MGFVIFFENYLNLNSFVVPVCRSLVPLVWSEIGTTFEDKLFFLQNICAEHDHSRGLHDLISYLVLTK